MPKTNTQPIDAEKLRNEIQRRGMTLVDISRKLGHTGSYMNQIIKYGSMTRSTILQIESMFNIKYEAIKPDEPLPANPKKMETPELLLGGQMIFNPNQITADKLFAIIYSATKKAIEDANKRGDGNNDGTEDQSDRIA